MMRKGFFAALIGLLTSAAVAPAEPPCVVQEPVPPVVGPEEVLWSAPPPPCSEQCPACQERVWFNADYLLWWVHRGQVNTPLVTTSSPLAPVPGALGEHSTRVLFGDETVVNFGTFSGVRLGGGFALAEGWLVEGNYFGLERRAITRSFNSNANGRPVLARPFFDEQGGAPSAYLDSFPGMLTGSVAVGLRTRLDGCEVNVAADVYRGESLHFEVLAGFRTLELNEDLTIVDNVTALVPGLLLFTGSPADPPSSLNILDRFHNYNHFYGGQVGARGHWRLGGLDVAVTGKIAVGTTQEMAIPDSTTTMNTPGCPPTSNPGGVLVQPSNTHRFYQSHEAYVPEFALDLGYWITPQIRLALGYQYLYWSRVARPGSEIDRTVNVAQVPRDPNFGNGLGDNRPGFSFHEGNFWAQGFNVGVRFQY
jgi:hypothetical protein